MDGRFHNSRNSPDRAFNRSRGPGRLTKLPHCEVKSEYGLNESTRDIIKKGGTKRSTYSSWNKRRDDRLNRGTGERKRGEHERGNKVFKTRKTTGIPRQSAFRGKRGGRKGGKRRRGKGKGRGGGGRNMGNSDRRQRRDRIIRRERRMQLREEKIPET
jgi:hypothetical protein